MDLSARKYRFIKELMSVEEESTMDLLEHVLKREKEVREDISDTQKKELGERLEHYKEKPGDLLDWEELKKDW